MLLLIMIVARPDRLRDGLLATLRDKKCTTRVKIADEAQDRALLLKLIVQQQPALTIVEFALFGYETLQLLQKIKDKLPQSKSLVLVEDFEQQQLAESSSADRVLFKGFAPKELFSAIDALLLVNGVAS